MPVDFSVIVPTFRRPLELGDAIRSALGQRGVTVEIVVIDDSPEGSARDTVASLADPRVTYFQNPSPTGGIPSVVRNLGWPRAQGTFTHFLDDDDIIADGHYAAVKGAFETHPDVGLVYGVIEPFGSGPAAQLEQERRYFAAAARKSAASAKFGVRWAFTARMLFDAALLVCSASVVRSGCIAPLGGFDPNIRLMEDADWHVRVMRQFGAYFLNRTAIHYRIGSPSLMHSPNPPPEQLHAELLGRRKMQTKYRQQQGWMEFYALALFARTVLRMR